MFSPAQVEQLLRPVNPRRVQHNAGQAHLAAYDVSAHLTRIFGFGGWRKEVLSLELVAEDGIIDEKRNRIGWYVTYRCSMRLHVGEWWNDDGATGSASNLPDRGDAHDFAMKNAISYALKRCAKDLGDQFGLSLYNKGSTAALVGRTLAHPPMEGAGSKAASVDADVPELAPDWDEQPPGREDAQAVSRMCQCGHVKDWHRTDTDPAGCGQCDCLLVWNADGSLSRSRTSDAEKDAAGVMTSGQLVEHTALQPKRADQPPAARWHPCDCAICRDNPKGPLLIPLGGSHADGKSDDPWYDPGKLPEAWLPAEPATPLSPGTIAQAQQKAMHAAFNTLGVKDREARLAWTRKTLGLDVLASSSDLSYKQAGDLLAALAARQRADKAATK